MTSLHGNLFSVLLALWAGGIHRSPATTPRKGPVMWKLMFFWWGFTSAGKQPFEWPVISDCMTFMWRSPITQPQYFQQTFLQWARPRRPATHWYAQWCWLHYFAQFSHNVLVSFGWFVTLACHVHDGIGTMENDLLISCVQKCIFGVIFPFVPINLGPLLLAYFNFDPRMCKNIHAL